MSTEHPHPDGHACRTCRFFRLSTWVRGTGTVEGAGDCRRHAPVVVHVGVKAYANFPPTHAVEYRGDYLPMPAGSA